MKTPASNWYLSSFILVLLLLCSPMPLLAATYYVAASASNDTGSGSFSSPKKYIGSGISLLAPGDTLIVRDGTYSTSNDRIVNVPNGTAGNFVTIKAENDGGAVVTTSEGLALGTSKAYIQIEGFKFNSSSGASIQGNHIKILRCAFRGGAATNNNATVLIGTNDYNFTQYVLLEDCWAWGAGGRYNFEIFNANHIILRRCVARHDGGWTDSKGDPEAGIAVYNSNHVELQNCITIDSDLGTYHTWGRGMYTIFNENSPGQGGIANPTNNVNWTGSIVLNVNAQCYESDGIGDPIIESTYTDIVCWNPDGGGFAGGSSGNITPSVYRGTFGGSSNTGSWKGGFGKWSSGTMTVTNTIVTGFDGQDFGTNISANYSDRYDNGSSGQCINCVTYDPTTHGLLYLPRIETGSGSSLAIAGSGGEQVGATILRRMGVSGTLYGETGYNTLTSENLWPWPNEARIRADMAADSTRGFCGGTSKDGTTQTLTKYIWEYLGNQIPAEIYADTPPPTDNLSPIASAGTAQTPTDSDNNGSEPVILNASQSYDPDGTIVSYTWKENGTIIATNVSPVVNLSVGSHTIDLTVTDDQAATATASVAITVNAYAAPLATLKQVNFQTSSTTTPAGYSADSGAIYSQIVGYGWDTSISSDTRERAINADKRLDTFDRAFDAVRQWQIAVPNGQYLVSLAVGDPEKAAGNHKVVLQGELVINGPTEANQFITVQDHPVTVSDGKLMVRIGGGAPSSSDQYGATCLNYVIIKSPELAPPRELRVVNP